MSSRERGLARVAAADPRAVSDDDRSMGDASAKSDPRAAGDVRSTDRDRPTPDAGSDDVALVARAQLAALLHLAYSGELAAAGAYRGHWKSTADPDERRRIREIEEEELHHRRLVGEMIAALGEEPEHGRELRALWTGRVLGALCRVTGWFARITATRELVAMYGAGRLESRNVREYEAAARHALAAGHAEWVDCLLVMAEVEWDHEAYFRAKVERHGLGRRLPLWKAPPPKVEIRASFARDAGAEYNPHRHDRRLEGA